MILKILQSPPSSDSSLPASHPAGARRYTCPLLAKPELSGIYIYIRRPPEGGAGRDADEEPNLAYCMLIMKVPGSPPLSPAPPI